MTLNISLIFSKSHFPHLKNKTILKIINLQKLKINTNKIYNKKFNKYIKLNDYNIKNSL